MKFEAALTRRRSKNSIPEEPFPKIRRTGKPALNSDSEWNERHEASYLLSNHHLHRINSEMKLPKLFLRLPKRNRGGAGSEIGPIGGRGEANPEAPRPAESAQDLRIDTPTSSTPSPRDRKSNGMESALS